MVAMLFPHQEAPGRPPTTIAPPAAGQLADPGHAALRRRHACSYSGLHDRHRHSHAPVRDARQRATGAAADRTAAVRRLAAVRSRSAATLDHRNRAERRGGHRAEEAGGRRAEEGGCRRGEAHGCRGRAHPVAVRTCAAVRCAAAHTVNGHTRRRWRRCWWRQLCCHWRSARSELQRSLVFIGVKARP